jgi:hypothetical protein
VIATVSVLDKSDVVGSGMIVVSVEAGTGIVMTTVVADSPDVAGLDGNERLSDPDEDGHVTDPRDELGGAG